MKHKTRLATEAEISKTLGRLWRLFTESKESRETVLEVFDGAEKYFPNKPHIVEWFANMKEAFLKAEAENAQEN